MAALVRTFGAKAIDVFGPNRGVPEPSAVSRGVLDRGVAVVLLEVSAGLLVSSPSSSSAPKESLPFTGAFFFFLIGCDGVALYFDCKLLLRHNQRGYVDDIPI